MRRAGIVADEQVGAGHEAHQLRDAEVGHRGEFGELGEQVVLTGAGDDDGLELVDLLDMHRNRAKALGGPLLRFVGCGDVQDGVGPRAAQRFGEEPRGRDFALRYAEMKHGGGDVLGGVNRGVLSKAENLLRARDAHVVDGVEAEVGEAGAMLGAGESCHPGAGRAAVEIEAERGAALADLADGLGATFAIGANDFVDVAGAF